jgi:hypothetical protein
MKSLLFVLVGVVAATSLLPNLVYAGGPDDAQQCYEVGYNNGQDGSFHYGVFDHCDRPYYRDDGKNQYYEGFIDGCVDADNSREICDRFADAG